MAPKFAGSTRGAYLFAIVVGNDETKAGVGITVGVWVVDGGLEVMVWCGVVWGWDVWGNGDELAEAVVITEGLGVPSVVRSDCSEFCKCLSIDKLIAWSCNS